MEPSPAVTTSAPKASRAPVAAADGVQALGIFTLTTETSLVIRGVPGLISVITKPEQELHFLSRAKDKSGGDRPIAVAFDGTTVTLSPPQDGALPEGTLRVEAPPSLAVRIEAVDGTVTVDGFAGAVAIVGKRTAVRAQALTGTLDADVEAGSLTLTNLTGGVKARIRAACALSANSLRGALDLNSQDATFKVQGLGGPCRLEAHGGSGDLAGLSAGGTLNLSETALRLTGGKGDVTVTSNASVTFSNMAGAMRLELDGGTLRGQAHQGTVAVRSRRTEINLESISGELDLDASRGNVTVQRASGPVEAVIFAGDAKLTELQGPLQLDMDGGTATVSWLAISGDRDSLLQNKGGDITVRFPGNAVCRVSATTRSGKITSDIPSIKAQPDTTETSGAIGQGQKPLIAIEADGSIHLTGGGGGNKPPSPPPPPPPPAEKEG
jgi:hypothetical protein